jgi:hypothetical protein
MATTYEQSSTTTSSEGIGLDKDYIKTYNGLLKIVECVSIHVHFCGLIAKLL